MTCEDMVKWWSAGGTFYYDDAFWRLMEIDKGRETVTLQPADRIGPFIKNILIAEVERGN